MLSLFINLTAYRNFCRGDKGVGEDDVEAVLEVRKIPLGKEKNDFFFHTQKPEELRLVIFYYAVCQVLE